MAKLRNLNVLKVDHNPIEWPPKSVMEPIAGSDNAPAMKEWIRGVQRWIEDNAQGHDNQRTREDSSFDEAMSQMYVS
jgi:hypothetical protein